MLLIFLAFLGFAEDSVRDSQGRVVEISMARSWAADADLERILGLRTLKRLDLSLTYVSDRGIERLRSLDQLEDLDLFAAEFITDAAVSFLRANQGLQRLNLRGTDITDASLAYIAELPKLKSLDIGFTQVSDVGMEHLAALTKLEELNLGGIKISGAGLHVLKLLPNLKKLSFQGIQRRNAGVCWAPVVTDIELGTLSIVAGLEELNIGWGVGLGAPRPARTGRAGGEGECRVAGGTKVTDLGLAKLTALKQLRSLDLSGALVTSQGLKLLDSLPKLESLSLWNAARIDDSAGPRLAALQSLTTLDLSATSIGDEGLRHLASLPRLKQLYLTDTQVTPEGAAAFQRERPDCFVSWARRPAAK